MNFVSKATLAKYALKRQILSLSPRFYWTVRKGLRGYTEREIPLLPALCRPGGTSIDVGANFGMYTYYLVQCSLRCEAFEPVPWLFDVLVREYRHMLKRVCVHRVALSDRDAAAVLRVPRANVGFSTIEPRNALEGKADTGAGIERYRMDLRRLDSYAFNDVSFIKIDVEGHEQAVLRGALALIEEQRPTLLIEVEDRHNPGAVLAVTTMLRERGYDCAYLRGRHLVRFAGEVEPVGVRNFLFRHRKEGWPAGLTPKSP